MIHFNRKYILRYAYLILLTLFLFTQIKSSYAAEKANYKYATPSLISEYEQINGSDEFWLLFQLDLKKEWHSYWRNPGDSGLAPKLNWDLPKGVTVSEIYWQSPKRFDYEFIMNFGHSEQAYYLVKIIPEKTIISDNLEIGLNVDWLVCKEDCIPESASLNISIPVRDEALKSPFAEKIDNLAQSAIYQTAIINNIESDNDNITINISAKGLEETAELYFFPYQNGIITATAKQNFIIDSNTLSIILKRDLLEVPQQVSGLLEIKDINGDIKYLELTQPQMTIVDNNTSTKQLSLLLILLSAFIGGIILNAMPCVFPILSIKAFSISRASEQGSDYIKSDGKFYTLGVIFCFLIIGGILLAVKASGSVIGWGFHMQSPTFIAILAYLFFIIGLNLSGFFEINISFNGGQKLTARNDLAGSFFTGMLATIIATPCTAPFMATALGLALTLPTLQAMLVFVFLGIGLAFPYLLLTHFPPLLKIMPKPGAWMETFKQLLAFPIYATAVLLLAVLAKQASADTIINIAMGFLGIAFAIWLYQRTTKWKKPLRVILTVIIIILSLYPINRTRFPYAKTTEIEQSFSTEKINQYLAQGTPVFVAAGADWCVTCKLNDRTTLNTDNFKNLLEEKGIKFIKADWTNADPAITTWLASFNRSGVPLYVYYSVNKEPIVLPQILRVQTVENYLNK